MSKASKSRPCPALGRDITPAVCGEHRNSQIVCPESCPFNPFGLANYDQVLDIEGRADSASVKRLAQIGPSPEVFAKEMAKLERQTVLGLHSFFAWHLFFAEAADKTTFAQRWEQASWAGLKNDERALMRAKMGMRVALLEVHRVFDEERLEAVDLLASKPEPQVFIDRSLAAKASRFSTLLGWVYPLPHYWRLCGGAVVLADIGNFTAREVIEEIARHLGGPLTEPEMRRWLAEHILQVEAALAAVAQLRRNLILAGLDVKWGKAVYELRVPFAQCRERLDAVAEVTFDEVTKDERDEGFADARHWADAPALKGPPVMPGGQPTLGRVLLGQTFWRLEAFGAEKLARLRNQFEKHCGDAVRFTGERLDDLASSLEAKGGTADRSLAPPRLLENPEHFLMTSQRIQQMPMGFSKETLEEEMLLQADKAFLEGSVPALDHRTPREAAQDPVLRPKLIQLMQRRVRMTDERNLRTGGTTDANWMLRELGLREIIFDPPPQRQAPEAEPEYEEDFVESNEPGHDVIIDPNRPPAPRLTGDPFGVPEAGKRLRNAFTWFDTAADAEAELFASGTKILDYVEPLLLEDAAEHDFFMAIPFLLQAWFAMVPQGCRAPDISYETLEDTYERWWERFSEAAGSRTSKLLKSLTEEGRQPGLTMVLLGEVFHATEILPKKERPSVDGQLAIMAMLHAVVEELDKALRA